MTELEHLPGHFYFADLHTTDVAGATTFYADLFGWELTDVPGTPGQYATAAIDGRRKAAITALTDEQRAQGVAPYWFPYLYVSDIGATLDRLVELGGTVVQPSYQVFDLGHMAVVADPTGASFGVWQDLQHATTVKDEHGSPFWYELHSTDIDVALAFYRDLLGWEPTAHEMGPGMSYYTVRAPESTDEQVDAAGAMGLMQAERDAGAGSYWAVYLNTDDTDATWARAQELGGSSMMEPHDIPDVGRSSWIADPQGATFAAMHPRPRD